MALLKRPNLLADIDTCLVVFYLANDHAVCPAAETGPARHGREGGSGQGVASPHWVPTWQKTEMEMSAFDGAAKGRRKGGGGQEGCFGGGERNLSDPLSRGFLSGKSVVKN
jgi:hypothetical protein